MAHKLKLSVYVGEIDSFKRNIVNSDKPPGEGSVHETEAHKVETSDTFSKIHGN